MAKRIVNTRGFWIWLIIIVLAWIFEPEAIPWLLILGIGSWLIIRNKNKKIKLERKNQRELVDKLQHTKKQIAVTDRRLSRMEKMAMLGELTAGIAHELKNPINYVVNSAGPLRRNIDELCELLEKYQQLSRVENIQDELEKIRQYEREIEVELAIKETKELTKGIEEGASRTSNIVKELREFTREDDRNRTLTNIHEAIESTLNLLTNRTKTGINLIRQYDPELPEIYGYPAKLKQVFMNLLDNAIDALEGKGQITVKTMHASDHICIYISDNGPGMSEDLINHIFDPFFSTKKDDEGTGLGLYISKRIIERHQGEIMVLSQEGLGTTFEIKLPTSTEN